ncbi:MAG: exonuclease domain-containing protein [Candidatus Niyogibacteria bacterium]|nr:exonuclease domain-containing protein [Candidatus Niyogibacteria bacterium]
MKITDLPKTFVLFDTEFTAWEGSQERDWKGTGEYRELVQIGAIRVQADTLQEMDFFNRYIKPRRNPVLSDYFVDLTGITQEMIENEGVDAADAIRQFAAWRGTDTAGSWGDDVDELEENCRFAKIACPIERAQFFDAQAIFLAHGIATNEYMSSTIPRAFGVEPERRGHNALADARTILQGLQLLRNSQNPEGSPLCG